MQKLNKDNAAELLMEKAEDFANQLQQQQGRTPRGIVSTQVRGAIMAMAYYLGEIAEEKKNG